MFGGKRLWLLAVIAFLCPETVWAQYALILKNGRRITVQSYRDEGGIIKFQSFGGEVGISRDQIQSIVRDRQSSPPDVSALQPEERRAQPERESRTQEKKGAPAELKKSPGPESPADAKEREEKEYQTKLRDITAQIKTLRDQYFLATKGSTSPVPSLIEGDEAVQARSDDLISRLKDVQHNPAGPSDAGGILLQTPSPFSGLPADVTELRPPGGVPTVDAPPPGYAEKERVLSELRNQIGQLHKEREALIEEMRRKGLETGSLFID
ncbi:MAG: hypothetical protein HY695_15760 [Deltaproteobacteria bacterium]|nr:hypothetical protein [Deltaproteobacteria bacterium]